MRVNLILRSLLPRIDFASYQDPTWLCDPGSGMPLDYEYMERLGWRPFYGPDGALAAVYRRGPHGYVRPDNRICEDVCERLNADEHTDTSAVSVAVRRGAVILRGLVADRSCQQRIEAIAETVSGVCQVANRLRILVRAPWRS
jgi:hypothetical protein